VTVREDCRRAPGDRLAIGGWPPYCPPHTEGRARRAIIVMTAKVVPVQFRAALART
jgi:hypothetical protein